MCPKLEIFIKFYLKINISKIGDTVFGDIQFLKNISIYGGIVKIFNFFKKIEISPFLEIYDQNIIRKLYLQKCDPKNGDTKNGDICWVFKDPAKYQKG